MNVGMKLCDIQTLLNCANSYYTDLHELNIRVGTISSDWQRLVHIGMDKLGTQDKVVALHNAMRNIIFDDLSKALAGLSTRQVYTGFTLFGFWDDVNDVINNLKDEICSNITMAEAIDADAWAVKEFCDDFLGYWADVRVELNERHETDPDKCDAAAMRTLQEKEEGKIPFADLLESCLLNDIRSTEDLIRRLHCLQSVCKDEENKQILVQRMQEVTTRSDEAQQATDNNATQDHSGSTEEQMSNVDGWRLLVENITDAEVIRLFLLNLPSAGPNDVEKFYAKHLSKQDNVTLGQFTVWCLTISYEQQQLCKMLLDNAINAKVICRFLADYPTMKPRLFKQWYINNLQARSVPLTEFLNKCLEVAHKGERGWSYRNIAEKG